MKTSFGIRLTGGLLLLAALGAPGARASAPAFASELTFLPSGAPAPAPETPPNAGESLYLDWVSPLQAPRGLEMPPPGPIAAPLPPSKDDTPAFSSVPTATAVPEPGSAALVAIGLLPFVPTLLRRRR